MEKKRIEQAITALDDDAFAVREKATKQLAKWGELAEPALRRTLSGQQTLEMGRRRGSTTSAAGWIQFIVSRLEARETMNRSPRSAPCHG